MRHPNSHSTTHILLRVPGGVSSRKAFHQISCPPTRRGESDTYAWCTALAVPALAHQYPNAARGQAEIAVDAIESPITPKNRRADLLVLFIEINPLFNSTTVWYWYFERLVESRSSPRYSA